MTITEEKTLDPTTHKLLGDIFAAAMRVNMETDYAVFVRFHGHTYGLEIEVCESKANFQEVIAEANIHITPYPFETASHFAHELSDRLHKLIDLFNRTAESGIFDTSGMTLAEREFTIQHYRM